MAESIEAGAIPSVDAAATSKNIVDECVSYFREVVNSVKNINV